MPEYLTKCTLCDCRQFCGTQTLDWDGEVDDNGVLACKGYRAPVNTVHCANCGALYWEKNFARFDFE